MKKKIVIMLIATLMMSTQSFVFAAVENNQTAIEDDVKADENVEDEIKPELAVKEQTEVLSLSMEDAVKYAIENSREMWKIDDGLAELKEIRPDLSKMKKGAEIGMKIPLGMQPDAITNDYVNALLAKNGYFVEQVDRNTVVLQRTKQTLNKGLEIGAKATYYKVLVAEKTIEINEGNLAKASEQLKVISLKFDNGSATKAEVLNGETAVHKAKSELDSSKDDLERAKLELINTIGLPLDTQVNLTDKELVYVPTININLDEALEKAKADRMEILQAENDLALQMIETHCYTAYYTSNLRIHKASVQKLKDAELNVPKAYKEVELDVRKSYLDLVKAERALINMDKTLELAKEGARIKKLLYENGMSSSLDVLEADTALTQAEIGKYQLLVSYNINKMMFDNSNIMGSSAPSTK